ncbi:hypothetical protein LNP74_16665 [Klebsiella pneumoniae subsp. pneumoniae]|nr:hypothetical protein [Klebsiella pneumoniae subsp. pneumoniae]
MYCQLKPEHQTPDTDAAVRQQFGEAAGKAFDTVINPDHLPSVWTALVKEYPTKVSTTCHGGIMGPNIWLKSASLPPQLPTFKKQYIDLAKRSIIEYRSFLSIKMSMYKPLLIAFLPIKAKGYFFLKSVHEHDEQGR